MENIQEPKKNTANTIFYLVLILAIFSSIAITYYKIIVKENYQIEAQVSCDPKTEKCFVTTCDPTTDDTCPSDPAQQTTYYKKISKKAASISACEGTADKIGCSDELSCIGGEPDCSYILCSTSTLEDGESCAE